MRLKLIFFIALLATTATASNADEWSPKVKLALVQPLVSYAGGIIRVELTSSISTNPANCTNYWLYDFRYDVGTQESRSAVVSALYMAFASGKEVKLYIDSSTCSPVNTPVIRGVSVE